MVKLFFPLVLLWSLIAVVLNLCGAGAFATWPITAWPWHWSCLCILWWDLMLTVILIVVTAVLTFIARD